MRPDRHTADKIRDQYQEIVTAYELGKQIAHITTDSASNVLKAFRESNSGLSLPGFEVPSNAGEDSDDPHTEDDKPEGASEGPAVVDDDD